MTLTDIEDELAIRRVLADYALRLELDSFESWLDLFTEDCTYQIFRRTLHGRQEIAEMLSKAPPGIHLSGSPRIDTEGVRARAVQNYVFVNGATREMNMGWYHCELARTPDGWRISHLRVQLSK